jgi:hypothetical protein
MSAPASRPPPVSARLAPKASVAAPAKRPLLAAKPAPVVPKPVRNPVQDVVLKALKISVPRVH